jgi:type II secretory ATPase GspE/PulE/Tfp pilus assembly ATPase PilB-like protein
MTHSLQHKFQAAAARLNPAGDRYVPELVDNLLALAREHGASDVHLIPAPGGKTLHVLGRVDGVLHEVAVIDKVAPNVVARLKVMAELLTYQMDVPQEGRIRTGDESLEMRVSTFPTVHGEKAVVRLFIGSGRFRHIEDLGLPPDTDHELKTVLWQTAGALVVAGPAGSGKTTTLYACLRNMLRDAPHPRSICTLEDPVEALVPGAAQSQVKPTAGFDYATGLRSLMRQDPEVIMVGEIRDRSTAETVFQASLTGQLVLTSFHAGSACEAIGRLFDLDVEPYLLRSGLLGVLSQRLVRRLCDCAQPGTQPEDTLGLAVAGFRIPVGCGKCGQSGYQGRLLLAEYLKIRDPEIARAVHIRRDAHELEQSAVAAGLTTIMRRALAAVEAGRTSPAEVRRVLGAGRAEAG